MLTASGIEGGLVYALSAPIRDEIAAHGSATVYLDLAPGKSLERVQAEVAHPRGSRSLSSHLQSRGDGVQTASAGVALKIFNPAASAIGALLRRPLATIAAGGCFRGARQSLI
jgi:predicted flavoprotein YhiN